MTSSSLLVVCGLTLTGSGQRPSDPKPVADDYLRLVELYVSGDVDSAVAAVRTWQVDTIRRLQATSWDRAVLRAAAMLETDAALLIAREAADQFPPYAVPAPAQQPIAFRIGLAEGWLKAADAIKPQDKSTFRGRWYAAVGRSLLGDTFLGLADSLLFDGCTLFPRDSEMLLACGTAREAAALHYSVNPAIALEQSDSPSYTRSERSQTIDTARTILQRVVNLWPDSAEARVRLAHLYVTNGNDRAAAPLLVQARQLSPPAQLGYVAALLFGDIAARRGELRDAIESYDQAKRLVPGTESAYLAHAFALRSAGDAAAAGVVLREMLARDRHAADPWTEYLLGLDDPAARLDGLRAEVRGQKRSDVASGALQPGPSPVVVPGTPGSSFESVPVTAPEVIVDVLVTRSNVPVTGLSAADFELRDSGVIQRVELIDGQSMPIDLRLAVDVSQAYLDSAGVAQLMDAVNAVATDRAPADRIEVLRFGSHIQSGAAKDERGPPAKRRSRLVDAAFASLALPELPDARRLVLLFSDGKDSSSWLSPAAAVRTARESRATVYAVTIPQLNAAFRSPRLNLERLHNWLMDDPRSFREGFLPVLINETGGELLNAASAADLRATFLDALSRFRQRYLLKYFPERRQPSGWRELNVRVRDKTMTVIVRRGVQQ